MNVDMGFFLTSEMREELSYRRKKVIEDYGSGLCGLLPQSRRGEAALHPLSAYKGTTYRDAAYQSAASPCIASNPSLAPSPSPQLIGSNHLIR